MIRNLFDRRSAKKDVTSGLTLAVESVPDGMAIGALAAINPISGVYAYMVGTFSGAFFTSSVSLSIQATSAMALIVAGVPEVSAGQSGAQDALLLLTLLTGAFMIAFGLLRLGGVLRFVPDSVMSSFTSAVGISIILGQLSNLTGYDAQGSNKPMQTIDLLGHLDKVDLQTLVTGLVAMFIVVAMNRTRLKTVGVLLAIFVASALPQIFGWSNVAVVNDIAEIPSGLPLPIVPDVSSWPDLVPSMLGVSLALAIVGLVQGAAVTHQFPNPDGSKSDPSGDFTGQGLANIPTGFLHGMPVGGSFSATAILVEGGARTRFANIVAGLGIALALLLFSGAIGLLAMPALAGFLIVLGVGILNPRQLAATWRLGGIHRWGMVILISVALFVSLQVSVFVGVGLSILLYIVRESRDVTTKTVEYEDGHIRSEVAVNPELVSESIVTLHSYGSLFYASAQYFEQQLPHPTEQTRNTVVILNLRGQRDLDTTTVDMLIDYAEKLQAHDCRLMLAEVDPTVRETLAKQDQDGLFGSDNVFAVSEQFDRSVLEAQAEAQQWVAARR